MSTISALVIVLIAVASVACSQNNTPPDRSYFYEGATVLGGADAPSGYILAPGDNRAPSRFRSLYRQ